MTVPPPASELQSHKAGRSVTERQGAPAAELPDVLPAIPAPRLTRAKVVDELRRLLPRMEGVQSERGALPFGLPALDRRLPQQGLVFGALHEIGPQADGDMPAAFGFVTALLGRLPGNGPVLLIFSARTLSRCGHPHGHGLSGLGLDPARVILAETADEKQALWATEEALRSAVPAAVVSAVGAKLDLKTSQRLQLAARTSSAPLLLLRPAGAIGTTAAVTRWHIGAAKAARDRFGLVERWRWRVKLERCRNGRPGEWVLEFDDAAHRFSLAAPLADPALSLDAGPPPLCRAG